MSNMGVAILYPSAAALIVEALVPRNACYPDWDDGVP
jgi:hypothetical protein